MWRPGRGKRSKVKIVPPRTQTFKNSLPGWNRHGTKRRTKILQPPNRFRSWCRENDPHAPPPRPSPTRGEGVLESRLLSFLLNTGFPWPVQSLLPRSPAPCLTHALVSPTRGEGDFPLARLVTETGSPLSPGGRGGLWKTSALNHLLLVSVF